MSLVLEDLGLTTDVVEENIGKRFMHDIIVVAENLHHEKM